MFGIYHFILIGLSFLAISLCLIYIKKKKPPMEKILSAACVICVLSEIIKTLTMLQVVPSADGSMHYLYLEMKHLPLHLCSIQIIFIFFLKFAGKTKIREYLLAFMYPSGVLGGLFALALPTYLSGMSALEIFISPRVYQYFIYHSMLIVLGLYIAVSGCVQLKSRHLFSSLGIIGVLGFASIYLNSMFASPVYEAGKLVSIESMPNYFFTQAIPINIPLTEKWHWFAWWGVVILIAVTLLTLLYLPFILKERKLRK